MRMRVGHPSASAECEHTLIQAWATQGFPSFGIQQNAMGWLRLSAVVLGL